MPRAFVDVGLVSLPELLHLRFGRRDRGIHARVVAAVEAQHRRLDLRQSRSVGRGSVIDDGGIQPRLRRRVRETFPSSPAESNRGALPLGGGELDRPLPDRIQPGGHLIRRQAADQLDDVVAARGRVGAAASGAVARDQVGRDRDEPFPGELVGDASDPVG